MCWTLELRIIAKTLIIMPVQVYYNRRFRQVEQE